MTSWGHLTLKTKMTMATMMTLWCWAREFSHVAKCGTLGREDGFTMFAEFCLSMFDRLNPANCLEFTSKNTLSGTITSNTRYQVAMPQTLSTLRKLKYLAKYELRKQLAETLILSKLDYADLVFYTIPKFLLRRLQRVQFAAASFVLGHYVKNFRDVRT